MSWLDRLLLIIEIAILLRMLKMDTTNSKAIQEFLKQRELWYSRRAHIRAADAHAIIAQTGTAENTKAPEVNPGDCETVVVLQETENEQSENL